MKAVLVKDGNLSVIPFPEGDDVLAWMQEQVEGLIELILVDRDNITVWCNDEGRIDGVHIPNCHLRASDGAWWSTIYGPVLITGGDDEGNTIGLTDDQLARLRLVQHEGAQLPTLEVLP